MERTKLMIMTTTDGQVEINEAAIDTLYDNADILYGFAQKGKSIYKDLQSHNISGRVDDVIRIIRHSIDLKEAGTSLQNEMGLKKQTAQYILCMPLTQLTSLDEYEINKKLQYYTKAVKFFKEQMPLAEDE